MRKKLRYRAIWQNAGQPQAANVDFEASSDWHAKKVANGLARELGRTNTARTIMRLRDYKLIECITTGVSD